MSETPPGITITTTTSGTATIAWQEKSRSYTRRIPGGVTLHVVRDGSTRTPVDLIHAPRTVWRSYVEAVCSATGTPVPEEYASSDEPSSTDTED